jgi:hypothetical protein
MSETTDDNVCPFCLAGWPLAFCRVRPGTGCVTESEGPLASGTDPDLEDSTEAHSGSDTEDDNGEESRAYRDARSTGRKRAAKLYKIETGQVCDWAWSKLCGGGIEPIIGCTGRPAEHIHHGPDKSTFSNERSNISLVCTYCHNRWHAANDPYYDKVRPDNGEAYLPRIPDGKTIFALEDRIPATREEVFANELAFPLRGKDKAALDKGI